MIENLTNLDFEPFWISFKLASVTTFVLFFISLPLSWFLSQTNSKIKPYIESLVSLPIVLPPSVLGFYLLWGFSTSSPLGRYLQENLNIELVFSFEGLVVASCFYSLPFMVQPVQSGMESLNKNIIEASYLSGKGKITTLFRVVLPNIKPSLLSAVVITFAHTIGEFGVVLMVGGNIDGETKVASVAIYEMVETLDFANAHIYSGIMLIISFIVLLFVYMFNHRQKKVML